MSSYESRLVLAAREDARRQEDARKARQRLQEVAIAAVENGTSEYVAAELAGVTRQAIRNWQGK